MKHLWYVKSWEGGSHIASINIEFLFRVQKFAREEEKTQKRNEITRSVRNWNRNRNHTKWSEIEIDILTCTVCNVIACVTVCVIWWSTDERKKHPKQTKPKRINRNRNIEKLSRKSVVCGERVKTQNECRYTNKNTISLSLCVCVFASTIDSILHAEWMFLYLSNNTGIGVLFLIFFFFTKGYLHWSVIHIQISYHRTNIKCHKIPKTAREKTTTTCQSRIKRRRRK